MKYKYAKSASDYLRYVLDKWERFKKANGGLCKAIKDLLEENEQLRAQIEKLRGGTP